WDVISQKYIFSWFIAITLICFFRIISYSLFQRDCNKAVNFKKWDKIFLLGLVLSALCWGAAGVLLFPQGDTTHQTALLLVLLGVNAYAVTSISYKKNYVYLYFLLSITPIFLNFYLIDSYYSTLMQTLIGIFAILFAASANRINRYVCDNFVLHYETARQNNELRHAHVKAQESSNAKSNFIATLHHELRTPLNSILGFSELLLQDGNNFNENDLQNLQLIHSSGSHLLTLVNEILEISVIESGKAKLEIEPTDLQTVVYESVQMISSLAQENDIVIYNNVTNDDIPLVLADRRKLRQVILNLLSNAIKYNKKQGNIVINWQVVDNKVSLSIIDSGQGISKDQQDKLFKPYQRLGAESSKVQGTGLGLSICQKLMTLMDGNITARCEINKGCEFTIELPQKD
ncbi:MAG: HAMP domain-containing sensor histidine kinase, partial [Gammaproteobacteria bacterium]|nr:HAMP domain-containing sensor histidine kinase [Gammaproteobacteria bacterium]